MPKLCTPFRLVVILALFVIPYLLHANGEPTSNPLNGNPGNHDSLALRLGHCNPITVVTVNCATKTIELSAFTKWTFTGILEPYVSTWSTGEVAHKITVVPPGAWSWDPSPTSCEPSHWESEHSQPGSFFLGNLQILSPEGICANGSTSLVVDTKGYDFPNYGWNPPNPNGQISPYEIFAPGLYTLTLTDQIGCPFTEQINIPVGPPSPSTYSLTSSINTLNLCTGSDAHFKASLTPFCDFNSPVTMTVTGTPPGATVNISPNPVTLPNVVDLSISGVNIPGNYTVTVTAVGGGITRTSTVALKVSPGMSGVPIAISPVNGETGVNTTPFLSWTAVPNANTYLVQVATNPSFSIGSLIMNQTVVTPFTTVSGLQKDTVYYWRVQAENDCQMGNYSATFAFQTLKTPCYSSILSIFPIPFDFSTANFEIDFPFNGIISDVSVDFTISHTWTGDLSARLISPSNDIALLFDRPGVPASIYGCGGENASLDFSNNGQDPEILEDQCNPTPPSLSGTFRPIQSFSIFNGKNPNGTWALSITDNYPGDEAYVFSIGLTVCLIELVVLGNILVNIPLTVSSNGSSIIGMSRLKMATTGTQSQGKFIVFSLPQHGTLTLNGIPLTIGSIFSQADINSNLLVYKNNCDGSLTDNFHFDALDQNNDAWVHDAVFNINIIPNNFTATAFQSSIILCNSGTTGAITISATPSGNYTYRLNGGTPQSSNVFSSLSASTYTVVITDPCGFSVSTSVTLASPPAISVSASVAGNDVIVNASGGTGTLVYSINGGGFQSSNQFLNLANGNYILNVRDANGCTVATQVTVAVNNLQVSVNVQSEVTCALGTDGVIIVTTSGGQLPYAFSLNGGANQASNVFSNLAPGNYIVLVTDATGFSAFSIQIMLANPLPIMISSTVITNNIVIAASGGTGLLTYSINGTSFQMSNLFSNLCNGVYTVTARDAKGCTATVQASIATTFAITAEINHPKCFGSNNGKIIATATGVQTPFTYSLNGGPNQGSNTFNNLSSGSYTVIVTDNNGCRVTSNTLILTNPASLQIITSVMQSTVSVQASGGTGFLSYSINGIDFQISNQFVNVANGTYTVTVRDANGCTATSTATVNVLCCPVIDHSPILCFGGVTSILVHASGGIPPYQYKLGNGQFQSGNNFPNLIAATFTVSIKDASNAIIVSGPIVITEPTPLNVSATVQCNDATLTISGGTPPYMSNPPEPNLKNLSNGTFQVVVTDGNGCTKSTLFTVNVPAIGLSFSTDSVLCYGGNTGAITASGIGGCPPYLYSLSGLPFLPNNIFSNLSFSTYPLTVKDSKGNLASALVTVFQPVLLGLSATINGNTISASASGGTLPYTYNLNGGPTQNSGVFSDLNNGTYTVVVMDKNGCTMSVPNLTVTVGVIEPTEIWGASVSPNPSNGMFRLTLQNAPEMLFTEIFNMAGQFIESFDFQAVNGKLETSLDIQGLPNGTYLLLLSDGKNRGSLFLSKTGE